MVVAGATTWREVLGTSFARAPLRHADTTTVVAVRADGEGGGGERSWSLRRG